MRTSSSSAVQNSFLGSHRFDAQTDEGNGLLKVLYFVSQKVSDTDPVFLGALSFCLDRIEIQHLKIQSKSFYLWIVSLEQLIKSKLQLTHNAPLDPFKKMFFLSAFLNFAEANMGAEAVPTEIFKNLETCTISLCMQLHSWIDILKRQKPSPLVLAKNFSALMIECQTNPEISADRKKIHDLMQLCAEQALVLDSAADYGYKVRFGATLYILSQLDKTKTPQFFQACMDVIHIDDLRDIGSQEKLTFLSVFFAVIPKVASNTYFYSRELETQKQTLQQMASLSYSKFALDTLQELGGFLGRNIVSEKLNQHVQNSLKRMYNFIHDTSGHLSTATRYSSTLAHSLLDRIGMQSSAQPRVEPYQEPAFITALLTLPDNILSKSIKIRIRDGNLTTKLEEKNNTQEKRPEFNFH
jgi:hypothetical protein